MSAPLKTLCGLACLGLVFPGGVGAAGPLFTAALSVHGLYDDNVFIQDNAPLAAGQTVAALPAHGRAFITAVGASLGLGWKTDPALQLDLVYAPEVFRYSLYQTENHTDHRFTVNAAGAGGDWRYEVKASWLTTVGSHESPVFNRLGGPPPVGSEPVRARRAQDIYKTNGRLTRAFRRGFVRGALAVNEQDFHTRERTTFGFANYVDRGEWSVGTDLGWSLRPNFFLVAAARGGRQHQADLLDVPLNYTNTLTRWLLGAEGQLTQACKFNVLAGPDVRQYGPLVRPGFARHQTATYWEASATWTLTKADQLTLGGRHTLWLSSGGRGAYVDTLFDLGWKHQLARTWSLTTGLNQHLACTSRYNPTAPRDDVIVAANCTFTHALDPKTKLDFGFAQDWSSSQVPGTPGREYHRRICSLGCSRLW